MPLKILKYPGYFSKIKVAKTLEQTQMTLIRRCLVDDFRINWMPNQVTYEGACIPLPNLLAVPLKDRYRIRMMTNHSYSIGIMIRQGYTWYNPLLQAMANDPQLRHLVELEQETEI